MNIWKIDLEGQLTELASDDGGVNAVVWVPSEDVAFHFAELPPGRQSVWEQTVAFSLEDRLPVPVEDQHFAIADVGGANVEEGVPVAVVSLERMRTWADAWVERGIEPRAVRPDVLAVPFEEECPTLWHEGGRCLLRLDTHTGVAGSAEWIAALLKLRASPGGVRVFSDNAAALPEEWRADAKALPCPLDECMTAEPGAGAATMNFLQGAFRSVSVLGALDKSWKWAAAAAVAAVFLHLAILSVETRMMTEATASLKRATAELYARHFPNQGTMSNLRAQVGRRMEQVRSGVVRREESPWKTLVRVEPVISSCKACRVEEIRLEDAAVSLLVSSSDALDGVIDRIRGLKGIKADSNPVPEEDGRKRVRLNLMMEKPA